MGDMKTVKVNRSQGWRATDRRQTAALESIASSLERLSMPPVVVDAHREPTPDPWRDATAHLGEKDGTMDPEPAPHSQDAVVWAPLKNYPTLTEGSDGPVMTRNENGSQSTPTQKRDAWLVELSRLEDHLATVLRWAESSKANAKAILEDTGYQGMMTEADYDATAWAAKRLQADLQALKAPEVPVDDALGQATIDDALRGQDNATGIKTMLAAVMDMPLDHAVFTSVDNPVEDGRQVHYVTEQGAMFHAILNSSRPPRSSGDEDEVTCRVCLHHLSERGGKP